MKSLHVLLITLSWIVLVQVLIVESSSSNDTADSNTGSSVTTPSKDMSVINITGDPPASAPSNDGGSSVSSNHTIGVNTTKYPSVSDDTSGSKITRGSSVTWFLNDTASYWYSPSHSFTFGFVKIPCTWYSPSYPFCADRYVVGVFLVKRSSLIWTTNRKDYKLPSSILFNNEGKLVLLTLEDNTEQPLISSIQEPASYAMMHDNGNFVLYGSDSHIVWQSFDHPRKPHLSTLEICLVIVKVFVGSVVLFVSLVFCSA